MNYRYLALLVVVTSCVSNNQIVDGGDISGQYLWRGLLERPYDRRGVLTIYDDNKYNFELSPPDKSMGYYERLNSGSYSIANDTVYFKATPCDTVMEVINMVQIDSLQAVGSLFRVGGASIVSASEADISSIGKLEARINSGEWIELSNWTDPSIFLLSKTLFPNQMDSVQLRYTNRNWRIYQPPEGIYFDQSAISCWLSSEAIKSSLVDLDYCWALQYCNSIDFYGYRKEGSLSLQFDDEEIEMIEMYPNTWYRRLWYGLVR